MSKRTLTPEAAMKIKQLYAEVDEWNRGVYTQVEIAKMMGCSETTVYRAIHSAGAYMALPELATEAEAEESLETFKKQFAELVTEASGLTKLVEVAAAHGVVARMVEDGRGRPRAE